MNNIETIKGEIAAITTTTTIQNTSHHDQEQSHVPFECAYVIFIGGIQPHLKKTVGFFFLKKIRQALCRALSTEKKDRRSF